jgi:ubiquinone/menaquinone biosynthesis C-methylase UbiE
MLLNRAEKLTMNNPVRAAIQRYFEVPRLASMGGVMNGGRALEVGCGRGLGTALIVERLGADRVDAFDLDPDMVQRARRRLARFGERVKLWQGDVTSIDAPADTYDAVFDFAIIHHVPDWRRALAEVQRVLRPGGRFYAEEVLARFILHPVWRRVFDHPLEDRFDSATFIHELDRAGLRLLETRGLWGHFGWFVADKPS